MDPRAVWTRRSFTHASLATVAAAGLLRPGNETAAAAEPSAADGFVDAHVHVWTPDLDRYPLAEGFTRGDMQPASFTAAELLAAARPLGISRVVLIQMSYYSFDNRYMLDSIAGSPQERMSGTCSCSSRNAIMISRRARLAPRQKCGPPAP